MVFTDNLSVDHTLTVSIGGTSWLIGKAVTYRISSNSISWSYTPTVTGPNNFTYADGTQQYSITSYRQNTKGVKETAQWSVQYSTDNGASWTAARPDWLIAFTASGASGVTPQLYNVAVNVQIGTGSNTHTTAL